MAFDPTLFDTVKDITAKPKWLLRAGFVAQRELQQEPETRDPVRPKDPNRDKAPEKGKKRKRDEASKGQPTTMGSQQNATRTAAAKVGDGSQPTSTSEGTTQREEEIKKKYNAHSIWPKGESSPTTD